MKSSTMIRLPDNVAIDTGTVSDDVYTHGYSLYENEFFVMTRKKKEHNFNFRAPVIEHYLNGISQREITRKASLSPGTVRSMLKDTRIRNV